MSEQKWISVKDRLPEPGEILVIFDNGEHGFLMWAYQDKTTHRQVRYWMPFPEDPPKPDEFEEWWMAQPYLKFWEHDHKQFCRSVWDAAVATTRKEK